MHRWVARIVPLLLSAVAFFHGLPTAADEPVDAAARQPWSEWQHHGHVWLLPGPEGADLPADTILHDVPVVIRLDGEFFDFAAAQPHGEDLRLVSEAGEVLPHEIEAWDRTTLRAIVWVRVPEIRGQARQRLTLHWGNPAAPACSDGATVFSPANGHVAVFHMDDPVQDATGSLESRDNGTSAVEGIVGPARHFPAARGYFAATRSQICRRDPPTTPHRPGSARRSPMAVSLAGGMRRRRGR